jgi:hypothetical protein
MKKTQPYLWALTFIALLLCGMAHSQQVEGKAEQLIRSMCSRIEATKYFSAVVYDSIDDVQDNGKTIQYSHVREIHISRPDKLRFESKGDVTNRILWKDGKSITYYDKDQNVYAQVDDVGTIDEMIDTLEDKYGVTLPVADLLSENILKNLTGDCEDISYLGLGLVGDERCHHILLSREDIDWQIWLSQSDQPEFKKMVINYKTMEGYPRYSMLVVKSQSHPGMDENVFNADLPNDAEKIDIKKQADTENQE